MTKGLLLPPTDRADWLKDRKNELDEQIDTARRIRENYDEGSQLWMFYDGEIDRLLIEKDNLSACVPNGWIEDAEADALDYADLKATQESALGRGW